MLCPKCGVEMLGKICPICLANSKVYQANKRNEDNKNAARGCMIVLIPLVAVCSWFVAKDKKEERDQKAKAVMTDSRNQQERSIESNIKLMTKSDIRKTYGTPRIEKDGFTERWFYDNVEFVPIRLMIGFGENEDKCKFVSVYWK